MRLVMSLMIGLTLPGLPGMVGAQDREPESAVEYYERGLKRLDDDDTDGGIADLSRAIELNPDYAEAYFSRSSAYAWVKGNYRKAADDLSEVIRLKPGDFTARFNRGLCYESLRQYDKAIIDYTRAIDPMVDYSLLVEGELSSRAHALHYRGRVYLWHKKDYEKALADFNESLRLDPDAEMVQYRRAVTNHYLGNYEDAAHDYEVANEADPDYSNLMIEWAWLLATCPDESLRNAEMSLSLAQRVCEKSRAPDSHQLDVLAAAYAENGLFDDAVSTLEEALMDVDRSKHEELYAALRSRLELYQNSEPYRESVPRATTDD